MRLSFTWSSGHPRLQLRLLRADGDPVKVVNAAGAEAPPPKFGSKGDKLRISDRFVAYRGGPEWSIRVFVNDVTGTKMTGLTANAIYDDTVDPTKTEALCEDENVDPNAAADFDKQLTIPEKK